MRFLQYDYKFATVTLRSKHLPGYTFNTHLKEKASQKKLMSLTADLYEQIKKAKDKAHKTRHKIRFPAITTL